MNLRHLALVGPTASGKSALALAAARELGDVEIVSMDSMQVYRGLDIGTAKPSAAEQTAVRHHLVDVADPGEEWSVARFQSAARATVADIDARGKRALLVGGTGLYVQAVIDDLRLPGENLAVRAALETRTAKPGGIGAAYAALQLQDPIAAARIDPHNVRRIVRALEVITITGRPFSSFGPGLQRYGPTAFPVCIAGVWLPRAMLAQRITDRVEAMFADEFIEEVRGLRDHGRLSRTAAQAIGYQELLAFLEDGSGSADAERDAIVRRTRSFARRQRMWFRRDPRILWMGTSENPATLLPALLASWS